MPPFIVGVRIGRNASKENGQGNGLLGSEKAIVVWTEIPRNAEMEKARIEGLVIRMEHKQVRRARAKKLPRMAGRKFDTVR